jgi:nucleotide-binding universal stress UspA family protein
MPRAVGRPYRRHMNSTPTVIAGYDGSSSSRAALAYAADRARHGQLFVVCATEPVPSFLGEPYAQHFLDRADEHAHELETEIAEQLPPEMEFEVEILEGPPAEAIVRVARVREADEIVIGSRGLGPLRAAIGSVSHDVLHFADRPVVIVPARAAVDAVSR